MDNKATFCQSSNLAKRRKDKENANREQAEKCEKKRNFPLKWQQTGTEVSVELLVGRPISNADLKFDVGDSFIHLEVPGVKEWDFHLYKPTIEEDTVVEVVDDKIRISLFKQMPNEYWPHLEDTKAKCEEMDSLEVDEPTVIELHHVKNDFYEKTSDTLDLHIYVKSIKKETFKVFFEEKHFTLKFQTCDPSFLKQQSISSSDGTVFLWKLHLKDYVIPDKCHYNLTNSTLRVVFRKKIPCRWGVLEAPENESTSPPVINTWVPVVSKNPGCQEATAHVFQIRRENEMEGQPVCRTSRSPARSLVPSQVDHASSVEPLSKVHIVEHVDNKKEVNQKPTCMVHPLNKNKNLEQVTVPGFTGLENLGNTCFMNSVIQCLANTREFRDYFLDGYYEDEINVDNPLGMKGNLAKIFAALLNVLWSGVHRSYAPSKLKTLIGLKASQFTGFAQHDAQELMTFLLDGLHEDLNRIKNKPYTQIIESDGKSDEEVANETWRLYKQRNDSVVVDLFQGQYKSKLVCPVCEKVSITFDPLFYLSVPLPKEQVYISVYFFSKDPYCRPIKFIIPLSRDAVVEELKEKVSVKTRVLPKNMRVFEVYKNKVHKFFGKGSSLSSVSPNDIIFVFEVLDEALAGESVHELCVIQRVIMPRPVVKCSSCGAECAPRCKLRRCTKCYKVGYCDQKCQKSHWQIHKQNCQPSPDMVGCPFILSIAKSQATFTNLCRLMEAFSRHSVDVFQPPVESSNTLRCSSAEYEDQNRVNYEEKDDLCNQKQVSDIVEHGQDSEKTHLGSDSALGGPSSSSSTSCEETQDFRVMNVESFSDEREKYDSNVFDSSNDSEVFSSSAEGLNINSPSTSRKCPQVRAVFGQPQELQGDAEPLFHIIPVNQHGQNMLSSDGEYLEAKDKNPLDLSSCYYIAMDWKNNEKLKNYALVETKELEWDFGDTYKINSRPEEREATLEQCLQLFTEPEVLSPQEAWYCPRCKEHREATIELSLWRLPPVLVIQLKRFSFKHLLLFRDKIDSMVNFPVRNLNFGPYSCGPESGSVPIYDLYAVINHHGGILGGHYTAYARCVDINNSCKSEVGWRLFDDSRVTTVSESQVVSKEAYILFYRRRNSSFRVGLPSEVPRVISTDTSVDESPADQDVDFKDSIDSDVDEASEIDSNIRNYDSSPLSQLRMVD